MKGKKMNKEVKQVLTWLILIIGNLMLWGSLLIGFIDWSYSMGFFRVSIAGLILVAIGTYLKSKWNLDK